MRPRGRRTDVAVLLNARAEVTVAKMDLFLSARVRSGKVSEKPWWEQTGAYAYAKIEADLKSFDWEFAGPVSFPHASHDPKAPGLEHKATIVGVKSMWLYYVSRLKPNGLAYFSSNIETLRTDKNGK